MLKSLVATALAATLALGTMAAPARADRAETLRTIAGLAALAVIANEIARQNQKDKVNRGKQYYYDDRPEPRHWGHDIRVLPGACAFDIRTHDGDRQVLGKACLRDQFDEARRLPERCEFTIRTQRGPRQVYGANCLRDAGYRIGSRW